MQEYEKSIFGRFPNGIMYSNKNYRLKFGITNQNRITDTLKIIRHYEECYLLIHAKENDLILKKYQLDAGL